MIWEGEQVITRTQMEHYTMRQLYKMYNIPNEEDGYVLQWELVDGGFQIKWTKEDNDAQG